ncbi:MAG: flavin monoamine oxidase family protein [Kineosporiaceae bacterium]
MSDTGVTRRQVLLGVGALGGVGAALAAAAALDLLPVDRREPFSPPSRGDFGLKGQGNDASVLVLGAGVAGLCCAYELEKAGYAVTVVEARDRVGGRNLTVRAGTTLVDTRGTTQTARFDRDRWFDAGPARIAGHHVTLDYCRELGVAVEVFVNDNPEAFVESRGTVRRRRGALADLDGYVSELMVKAVGRGALDEDLSVSDRNALVQHLHDVGAVRRSRTTDTAPAGEADGLGLLLGLGMGARIAFERDSHMAPAMFHPVGGMDAIVTALREAVSGQVRTGLRATRIGDDGRQVRVDCSDAAGSTTTVTADHGICTLPPHLAVALPSPWDTTVRTALAEPEPLTTGKIGLEYGRRFWEEDDRIFGGITVTSREARVIWYPSSDYLGDGGVVVGAYPFGPAADRFSRLSHPAREEAAVETGTAIHGAAYRRELRSSFSVDWRTQPFSEGAWSTWRRYGVSYGLLQEPVGRWWFAGDWLSRAPGWQHGAFTSARRAVSGLHRRVMLEAR